MASNVLTGTGSHITRLAVCRLIECMARAHAISDRLFDLSAAPSVAIKRSATAAAAGGEPATESVDALTLYQRSVDSNLTHVDETLRTTGAVPALQAFLTAYYNRPSDSTQRVAIVARYIQTLKSGGGGGGAGAVSSVVSSSCNAITLTASATETRGFGLAPVASATTSTAPKPALSSAASTSGSLTASLASAPEISRGIAHALGCFPSQFLALPSAVIEFTAAHQQQIALIIPAPVATDKPVAPSSAASVVAVAREFKAARYVLPTKPADEPASMPLIRTITDALLTAATLRTQRDTETRRNAIRSLAALCETLGPLILLPVSNASGGGSAAARPVLIYERVVSAILSSFDDYTTDRQGDVGSWVREAAMQSIERVAYCLIRLQSVYADRPSLITPDLSERIMQSLLQQMMVRTRSRLPVASASELFALCLVLTGTNRPIARNRCDRDTSNHPFGFNLY